MANFKEVKAMMVNFLPSPKFWLKRWWGKPVAVFVFVLALLLIWGQIHPANAAVSDTLASYMLRAMNAGLQAIANLISGILLWLFHFIIQLSGYNNFLNARVVQIGWSLTRDIANMFYILVLLLIAFGTMLKLERYDWRKNLPRLLFTALLVNFSKTIIGILIDFGQVVMLTFVNGYAATAGGNFVTMFGMDQIFKLATTGEPPAGEQLTYSITMGYILGVVVLGISVIVIAVFAAILLFRIIMLWILIVLAPLAFLMGAVPVPKFAGYYSRWWDQLINQIVVGPVVAFFLWLSLATMGSGNNITEITDNNAIPESILNAQGEAGIGRAALPGSSTEFSNWENLGSFAVAIAMLFAGLQFIQELGVAGAGLAGSAGGMIKGMGSRIARSPLTAARFGAGQAWKGAKAGAQAGGRLGMELTAPARAGVWSSLSKAALSAGKGGGKAEQFLTGAIALTAGRRAGRVRAELKKSSEEKVRDFKSLTLEEKMDLKDVPTFMPSTKLAKGEMLESMITDRNFSSKINEKWGAGDEARNNTKKIMDDFTTYAAGDKDKLDKLDEFKKRNPHLLTPGDEVRKQIEGLKVDDVVKLSKEALSDPTVVRNLNANPRLTARLQQKGSREQIANFTAAGGTFAPMPRTGGQAPVGPSGPRRIRQRGGMPPTSPVGAPVGSTTPAGETSPAGSPLVDIVTKVTNLQELSKAQRLIRDAAFEVAPGQGSVDPEKIKERLKQVYDELKTSGVFEDKDIERYKDAIKEIDRLVPPSSSEHPSAGATSATSSSLSDETPEWKKTLPRPAGQMGAIAASIYSPLMDKFRYDSDKVKGEIKKLMATANSKEYRKTNGDQTADNYVEWYQEVLDHIDKSNKKYAENDKPRLVFSMKPAITKSSDGKTSISNEAINLAGAFGPSEIAGLVGKAKNEQERKAVAALAAVKAAARSVKEAESMKKQFKNPAFDEEIKKEINKLIEEINQAKKS